VGIARPFLTATRVGVRYVRVIGSGIVSDLLLSQNNAVFNIEIEVAGTLIPAIGDVR